MIMTIEIVKTIPFSWQINACVSDNACFVALSLTPSRDVIYQL